jgi:hypothetical protein
MGTRQGAGLRIGLDRRITDDCAACRRWPLATSRVPPLMTVALAVPPEEATFKCKSRYCTTVICTLETPCSIMPRLSAAE